MVEHGRTSGPAAAKLGGATLMDRDARRAAVVVGLALVLGAAGCVLPAQPTEPVAAFAQAERYYLETGRALEAARRLMRDYEKIGVLSAEDMIEVQRVWAEARAAMDAWWEVLAEAEKYGYQLPAGHTAALLAAQDALARFRAALVAAKATKEIPSG